MSGCPPDQMNTQISAIINARDTNLRVKVHINSAQMIEILCVCALGVYDIVCSLSAPIKDDKALA